jgi:hypothetical protein
MQRTEIFIASPQEFNSPEEVAHFLDRKFSYKGFFFMGISYVLFQADFGMTDFAVGNEHFNQEVLKVFSI